MIKLIVFDFDGTIRINSHDYRIKKNIIKKLDDKKIKCPKKRELLMREEFLRNCEIKPEMQKLIKSLASKYVLVILSIASKDYVAENLNKYNLKRYFKRIYSTKDDFNTDIKEKSHFKKIFDDFSCNPSEAVHIADDYGIDYISNELGCKTLLVDCSPIKKIKIEELEEKIEL